MFLYPYVTQDKLFLSNLTISVKINEEPPHRIIGAGLLILRAP